MGKYGLLISPPVELQRKYFEDMTKLIGVNVMYQYPTHKHYNNQTELMAEYSEPEEVGCIFTEYLDQKTARKLGWVAEAQDSISVIHLPYNLQGLQIGCLVEVPSAFDDSPGRKFRITDLSAISIYPSSIACRLAPEIDTVLPLSEVERFDNSNFNLLREE